MTATLLIVCLFLPDVFSLESIEIFSTDAISIYKTSNGYLVTSRSESKLVTVDSDFKPLNTFEKVGDGPDEIRHPIILGVTETQLFVMVNNQKVQVLDHDLKIIKTLPRIPIDSWGGVVVGENRFALNAYRGEPWHGEVIVDLEDGRWRVKRKFFPLEYNEMTFFSKYMFQRHSRYGAFFLERLTMENSYEVTFYEMNGLEEPKPFLAVSESTEVIDNRENSHVFLANAYYDGQFAFVHFLKLDAMKGVVTDSIIDTFDSEGDRVGRSYIHEVRKLIPIRGTSLIYELDPNTLVANRLNKKLQNKGD